MQSTAHRHEHAAADSEALRAAGLRVTAQRLAVLSVCRIHPHSTAEEVHAQVREQLGSVSRQAVFDVLNTGTEHGLLRRIEPAGHPARYETRVGDNHHHVVCRRCGVIADVDCAVGHSPCLTPATDHGFLIDEAEVIYWGLCADCRPPARSEDHQRNTPGGMHDDHSSEGQ